MNMSIDTPAAPARPAPADHAGHAAFWLERRPELVDVTIGLPDACVDELERCLRRLPADGAPQGADPTAALPRSAALAAELRERLEHAPGTAIVDRFPAERHDEAGNRALCALFASLVAPLMAQNHAGVTLYDVKDKKVADTSTVRRSITNLGQAYHTDGGWVSAPARYIGLYCVRNAGRGGHSRVTSLLAACDALATEQRAELSRPHPWDRQGEHGADERPWSMQALIEESDAGFLARFYESYVRKGYEKRGEPIPDPADAALTTLGARLEAQSAIRFLLEPGQFQYANNYTVVHAREAFEDADAARGRHLIRVWHR